MRKKSKKEQAVRKMISLPPAAAKVGDKAAQKQGRSLSNYVTQLIIADAK